MQPLACHEHLDFSLGFTINNSGITVTSFELRLEHPEMMPTMPSVPGPQIPIGTISGSSPSFGINSAGVSPVLRSQWELLRGSRQWISYLPQEGIVPRFVAGSGTGPTGRFLTVLVENCHFAKF